MQTTGVQAILRTSIYIVNTRYTRFTTHKSKSFPANDDPPSLLFVEVASFPFPSRQIYLTQEGRPYSFEDGLKPSRYELNVYTTNAITKHSQLCA